MSEELLPVLQSSPAPSGNRRWWGQWSIRLYRLLVIGVAAWLLNVAQEQADQAALGPAVSLEDARRIFPYANRLGPRDRQRDGHPVLDAAGDTLGFLLKTAPQTDDIVGYSGPNNLLIGLDPEGAIVRVVLLSSGDTPAHVKSVLQAREFWKLFNSWRGEGHPFPAIEGVSGSTLTSLAMAEAVQRRLSGGGGSLRFPQQVSLAEVQSFFPAVQAIQDKHPIPGWTQALGQNGEPLGYVVRTSPVTDGLLGYAGPTESLFAVANDQQTILGVRLRSSYDTPEYVDRVREASDYFELFAGRTRQELRDIDFVAAGIEGVSGATQTSFAVAEGLRRRIIADEVTLSRPSSSSRWAIITWNELGLVAFVLGACWLTFVRWPHSRWVRPLWQVALMGCLGLWLGSLLSVGLFAGWSRHGIPWATAPSLVMLVAISLLTPWGTRQQIYCHQLCPHGAAQEWLGRFRRFHIRIPRALSGVLGWFPAVLLVLAFLLGLANPTFDLAQLEPFDGWVLKSGAVVSLTLLVVSLLVSLFLPQGYCRYGCPTGALLKFVRSHSREKFGSVEGMATCIVGGAAFWLFLPQFAALIPREQYATDSPVIGSRLLGNAFGTHWSVTLRETLDDPQPLLDAVSAELERIEATLSHWRADSQTSQFNASETTFELEYAPELVDLVAFCQSISEATQGRYDVTIAPLVDAWGYGPSRRGAVPPDAAEIERLLPAVGWQKLHVDQEFHSLRKEHPALAIDLGSVLQGYACDHLAALLTEAGHEDFLIDVGGELCSRGEWRVAVEGIITSQPQMKLKLENAALATSGTYRASSDGEPRTLHVISPQTGQPVESPHVLAAVVAVSARDADAWATACLVSTTEQALALATAHQFSLLLIEADGTATRTGIFLEVSP